MANTNNQPPAPSKAEQPKGDNKTFATSMVMWERVLLASIPEARRVSTKDHDGHNAAKIELDEFSGIGRGLIGLVITDRKGHRRLVPWSRVDVVDLD